VQCSVHDVIKRQSCLCQGVCCTINALQLRWLRQHSDTFGRRPLVTCEFVQIQASQAPLSRRCYFNQPIHRLPAGNMRVYTNSQTTCLMQVRSAEYQSSQSALGAKWSAIRPCAAESNGKQVIIMLLCSPYDD
jgi:hypothetical protein